MSICKVICVQSKFHSKKKLQNSEKKRKQTIIVQIKEVFSSIIRFKRYIKYNRIVPYYFMKRGCSLRERIIIHVCVV